MIRFYFHTSPNPMKVALFLEEAALPYELIPVDTRRGEQFAPEYMAINPNAKTPAIVDGDAVVFDSNGILLYLAEKTGRFLPENTPVARGALYSWMMFVATGIGPYSGQAVHFRHFAPEPKDYPVQRYTYEAERHWKVLDTRLDGRPYVLGDTYTIVDMAVWGWARAVPFMLGQDAWDRFPNVHRLFQEISARPAAQRADALRGKFDFKQDMDAQARRFMFPQIQHPDAA